MCYRLLLRHLYVIPLVALVCLPIAWADNEPDLPSSEISSEAVANEDDAVIVSEVHIDTTEPDAATATDHMIGIYYAYQADRIGRRLSRSGLAKPEIDYLVDAVAKEYAVCIVSSLQKTNNDESAFVIEMLATGAAVDDIGLYVRSLEVSDTADPLLVFDEEAAVCMESLGVSYGLRH